MPGRPAQLQQSIAVEIIEDDGDWSSLPDVSALVQAAADAVMRSQGVVRTAVSVAIVLSSDGAVAELNRQFRSKPQPTNVLSFPAGVGAPNGFLGDIVLAAETIAREAIAQDTPLPHHVQHLVVHGVLHLLGHDHEAAAEAERMETLEIAILAGLGIANPYTGALENDTQE